MSITDELREIIPEIDFATNRDRLRAIADLIDMKHELGRGTCEIVYERLGSHRCTACGARFFLDDDSGEPNFYDESGRATFPNFCPNCGAKVVDDASVD